MAGGWDKAAHNLRVVSEQAVYQRYYFFRRKLQAAIFENYGLNLTKN
jgi:hypothetical protein